jgi:phthalate 4,5-dioxygenase oxygenase subunit
MLTREENDLLCQVGPATAMGRMLRQYWTPALRGAQLEADGAPVRVRLLGENFVAVRATDGRVGFFAEGCPHRCTSLALARNEDNALTCIFHGWKIDVSGKVVEVPSEPPERRAEFAAKVRVAHYPVREAGGIVWVYLGARTEPPPFFDFEFTRLPPDHVIARRAIVHANWFQGFEGVLDSAHLGQLHQGWIRDDAGNVGIVNDIQLSNASSGPVFEFLERPYGFREGALRDLPDGLRYARIREVVYPYFAFIPTQPGHECATIFSIPLDDYWCYQWYVVYHPDHPLSAEEAKWGTHFLDPSEDPNNFSAALGTADNCWHQDRAAIKAGHWSGLMHSVPWEDFAIQEAMTPIVDRSREYLGSSDSVIIRVRRALIEGARAVAQGKPAPGLAQPADYSRIRALSVKFPRHRSWRELSAFSATQP